MFFSCLSHSNQLNQRPLAPEVPNFVACVQAQVPHASLGSLDLSNLIQVQAMELEVGSEVILDGTQAKLTSMDSCLSLRMPLPFSFFSNYNMLFPPIFNVFQIRSFCFYMFFHAGVFTRNTTIFLAMTLRASRGLEARTNYGAEDFLSTRSSCGSLHEATLHFEQRLSQEAVPPRQEARWRWCSDHPRYRRVPDGLIRTGCGDTKIWQDERHWTMVDISFRGNAAPRVIH